MAGQRREKKLREKQIPSLSPLRQLSTRQSAQCLVAAGAKSDGNKRWFGY